MQKGYRLKENFEKKVAKADDETDADAELDSDDFVNSAQHFIGVMLVVGFLTQLFWEPLIFFHSWNWFLVPMGLKKITYLHAMGLMLILNFTALKIKKHESDFSAHSVMNRCLIYVASTSVYFFTAWLAHFWI